jgi:nucleoside-diphosphate-sugar epimerase
MNILFIGGTGNISTDCAALLHQQGHKIYILSRGRNPLSTEYTAVRADRKDLSAARSALKGIRLDAVLNFIGYEVADIELDFQLFSGAIGQYVFISSATVYAKPPQRLPVTEDAPLGNDFWEYAQKKLKCEQFLQQRHKTDGFPVTIVRPSHTYSHKWIPNILASSSYSFAARLEKGKPVFVPDDGTNPWTLTATSDFAVGFAGLVGNSEAIGEVFHITSDETLTWPQIYSEIASALGAPSPNIVKIPTDFLCQIDSELTGPLKGDKSHPAVFDNSKIKRFVSEFECRKPFAAGIRESVAWLRQHPEQQNPNPKVDATMDSVIAAWEKRGKV